MGTAADEYVSAVTEAENAVREDQAVSGDPEAPYGRKPDGTPYKRDPEQMRRIGAARRGGRGPAPRAARERAASSSRPAAAKATAPKYGKTLAKWISRGADALLSDPVERAIIRLQSVELIPVVDRILAEDPRLVAWIERLRLRMAGGAKAELLGWAVTTGGMLAVHRGYRHPLLVAMLGGAVEAATVHAAQHERMMSEQRAEAAAVLDEIERERAAQVDRQRAAAAGEAAAAAPYGYDVNGARLGSPLGQFTGAGVG